MKMNRLILLGFCIVVFANTAIAAQTSSADFRATLTQYCFTCHNERLKTGGLALEGLDVAAIGSNAETWEKVVRKLRSGMMPPQGSIYAGAWVNPVTTNGPQNLLALEQTCGRTLPLSMHYFGWADTNFSTANNFTVPATMLAR